MIISLIVAAAENGIIGREKAIPWHLPRDLKRFRRLTKGHHVIMGRRTYESIGRPLADRVNLVLSESEDLQIEGCTVLASLVGALALARENGESETFIIGGARVYAEAIELADSIHLTRVHERLEGDTALPLIRESEWRIVSIERHEPDSQHAFAHSFIEMVRSPNA